MILEIIYAGVIGLLVYLLINYFIRLTELKNYPPGPIPLPVIGNLHLLGLKPHESLVQLSKKYGPVMSLSIGPQRIVVFNSIEPAKEALLKKGEEFAGRPQDVISAEIVTHGYNDIAFSDYGPSWKMMRKVAHSSMKMFGAGMEDLEGKVLIEIEELFGRFDAKEGTPFNPYHDMALGVLNIICSIIFGNRYDVNDPEFIDIIQFNRDLVQGFDNSSALAFMPWLKFFPNKGLSQLKRAVKLRDEIMYKKIKEHKETFDASNHRDLTDALWNEFLNEGHVGPANNNIRLTEKNFEMILTDLFVAGSETTTTTLQWSVLYLSKWPEVQKKIAEERENVIGERQPRLVDRGKLHYFEATMHEIMRFSSLVPLGVPHKTICDTEIHGHHIPKGTQIWFNTWAYHNDERYWKDPKSFKPERWLNEDGEFVPGIRKSYLPFGAGRRVCLGEAMAKIELFLFLSNILQRYEIQQVPGECPPSLEGTLSVAYSPKPFNVVLKQRGME
eukprot:gene12085-13329_t